VPTAWENRRPGTLTRETWRTTSGSVSGRVFKPGSAGGEFGNEKDSHARRHHGLATNVRTGKVKVFGNDEINTDAVLASGASAESRPSIFTRHTCDSQGPDDLGKFI
jgi:hypothetical protein